MERPGRGAPGSLGLLKTIFSAKVKMNNEGVQVGDGEIHDIHEGSCRDLGAIIENFPDGVYITDRARTL
jgi:hypothetical protein